MSKRIVSLMIAWALLLGLCACGQGPSGQADSVEQMTWQEQYDLGLRYLEEGNYEEAILAFTAAIEIDPKRVEGYIGLADAYIGTGDYDKALEILQQGLEKVKDSQDLSDKIREIEDEKTVTQIIYNSGGGVEFLHRDSYSEYDMLSSMEQSTMLAYIEALLVQDKESLLKLSEEAAYKNQQMIFLTIWNNYKVRIDSRSQVNDGQYKLRNVVEIEVRPQNDVGYYARVEWVDYQPEYDSAGFFEEVHSADKSVTIITCPCENWTWNGEFNSSNQNSLTQEYWREGIKSVSHTLQERNSSGNVIDGMCDGVTVETIVDTDLDSLYTHQSTAKYYCDNGTLLKWENNISGEVRTYTPQTNDGVCIIYHCSGTSHSDRQSLLDRLYW